MSGQVGVRGNSCRTTQAGQVVWNSPERRRSFHCLACLEVFVACQVVVDRELDSDAPDPVLVHHVVTLSCAILLTRAPLKGPRWGTNSDAAISSSRRRTCRG